MKNLYLVLVLAGVLFMPSAVMAGDERIAVKELKAKMDKGEDIIILDVRTSASYMESKAKIKGAVRIDPAAIEAKYRSLPMDKEIITYCT
ncbi:MAG: hypothetical protein HZB79_00190 [Deltaproteobacteria bacterium]|nr:hypothetical protein [Deltaproteobacteria bacterium]